MVELYAICMLSGSLPATEEAGYHIYHGDLLIIRK